MKIGWSMKGRKLFIDSFQTLRVSSLKITKLGPLHYFNTVLVIDKEIIGDEKFPIKLKLTQQGFESRTWASADNTLPSKLA